MWNWEGRALLFLLLLGNVSIDCSPEPDSSRVCRLWKRHPLLLQKVFEAEIRYRQQYFFFFLQLSIFTKLQCLIRVGFYSDVKALWLEKWPFRLKWSLGLSIYWESSQCLSIRTWHHLENPKETVKILLIRLLSKRNSYLRGRQFFWFSRTLSTTGTDSMGENSEKRISR